MPRVSKGPSYEPSKRRWVANINKDKFVLLADVDKTADTKKEAETLYYQHRATITIHKEKDKSPVWSLLNEWVYWLKNRTNPPPLSPNTITKLTYIINTFTRMHGNVLCRDLKTHHFDSWLAEMKRPKKHPKQKKLLCWGQTMQNMGLTVLNSAFVWANTIGGILSFNPLRVPGAESLQKLRSFRDRSKKLAIETEEHVKLLEYSATRAEKSFANILCLLYHTGARPAEIFMARGEEWNEKLNAFVIRHDDPQNVGRFKLARMQEDRIVYVPNELLPLVNVLLLKHGKGRLFYCERSKRPFRLGILNNRFDSTIDAVNRRAGKEVVRPHVSPYSYRHGFVTRWVQAKKDLPTLAALLGTSVSMIEKYYSHLFQKHDVLRDRLNQFEAERPESGHNR